MDKIKSDQFYQVWIDTINNRKDTLLRLWRSNREYTCYIKGDDNCVLEEVANKLNLLCYPRDYYSIDALFYKPEDLVDNIKEGSYWFKDIRVAIEHENNFKSGLYQEVAHLLLINADLKVLVTYPNDDPEKELQYLHQIISSNRQSKNISEEESFLLILGSEKDFLWEGLIYKEKSWSRI